MIVVMMRDKDSIPTLPANFFEIKFDLGKGVAVSTKGVFKDGVKNKTRSCTLKKVTSMKNSRHLNAHRSESLSC